MRSIEDGRSVITTVVLVVTSTAAESPRIALEDVEGILEWHFVKSICQILTLKMDHEVRTEGRFLQLTMGADIGTGRRPA